MRLILVMVIASLAGATGCATDPIRQAEVEYEKVGGQVNAFLETQIAEANATVPESLRIVNRWEEPQTIEKPEVVSEITCEVTHVQSCRYQLDGIETLRRGRDLAIPYEATVNCHLQVRFRTGQATVVTMADGTTQTPKNLRPSRPFEIVRRSGTFPGLDSASEQEDATDPTWQAAYDNMKGSEVAEVELPFSVPVEYRVEQGWVIVGDAAELPYWAYDPETHKLLP